MEYAVAPDIAFLLDTIYISSTFFCSVLSLLLCLQWKLPILSWSIHSSFVYVDFTGLSEYELVLVFQDQIF